MTAIRSSGSCVDGAALVASSGGRCLSAPQAARHRRGEQRLKTCQRATTSKRSGRDRPQRSCPQQTVRSRACSSLSVVPREAESSSLRLLRLAHPRLTARPGQPREIQDPTNANPASPSAHRTRPTAACTTGKTCQGDRQHMEKAGTLRRPCVMELFSLHFWPGSCRRPGPLSMAPPVVRRYAPVLGPLPAALKENRPRAPPAWRAPR